MSNGYGEPRRPGPGGPDAGRTQKLPSGGYPPRQQAGQYDQYGRGGYQDNRYDNQYDDRQYGNQQYGDRYGDQYGEPGGGVAAPPRPPRRRPRIGRILLGIVLVLLLLIGAGYLYVELSMNRTEALTDYPGRPAAGAGTNWLVVGSDSRADLTEDQRKQLSTGDANGQRTDTIMLLHIPDNDSKPTLVSLLRDSYVPIPGHGKNKLNAAYSFGGPKLLAQTVEMATGVRLDHYIEIGFGGFANLVDDVGGVDICVKKPINDPKAGIKLKAGCQELDGRNALGYVRTRATARADLDRVMHQREFISALTDKATSFGTVINPLRIVPLIWDAPDAITVDSGDHLHNLPSLAFAMAGAGDGSLTTTTVPIGGSDSVSGVGSVILWDKDKAQQLFHALNTDQAVPKDVLTNPANG